MPVHVYRDPEDPSWWIAEAVIPEYVEIVVDQGRSPEEALRNCKEAILLSLEELGISGEIELRIRIGDEVRKEKIRVSR